MKGVIKRNKSAELIVQYKNIFETKELKINPRFKKKLKEGTIVDFEEIKINPMGRKVDPMNLAQNQSSCIWVADIIQVYEDKKENEEIYSEIEHILIHWQLNKTQTAGYITRKIINALEKFKKS
jgi:hypothetical protein